MNTITDNLLTCRNASFGYDGHAVVRDVSFTVRPGDYLCILGENGSGKSTLLKGLLRLLPPLSGPPGSVTFAPSVRANEIGYLSQAEAAKKDFPAGVGEIVLSGLVGRMGLRPFYTRKEKAAAEETMRRLEVFELKNRCFRELSGGQQRRVLIARALCAAQKLLALDEPAAGLDPLVTGELYALLAKINQEAGVTLIVVTHDIQGALKYASHILHLAGGGYFFGTTGEYTGSDFLKRFKGEPHRRSAPQPYELFTGGQDV
ncbi:MAG: ATP-binding cassette domain-containing protein [Spirochaetaceae bacterium]|jgi:zinc transport system ATP-binding protein|nr:ATP-binding cassette domain-containing protein [Spirochaetaceae bacterium]